MIPDPALRKYEQMPDKNLPVHIVSRENRTTGHMFDEHWHPQLQFIFITNGGAVMHCQAGAMPIQRGDLLLINGRETHYFDQPYGRLGFTVVRIDAAMLASFGVDACQTKYVVPLMRHAILFKNDLHRDREAIACIKRILKEERERETGYELSIKAYAYQLLALLLRRHVAKIVDDRALARQVNDWERLEGALEIIKTQLTEKVTLRELARAAHMSEHHFCRVFKRVTGQTAVAYIIRLRIARAVELLQEGRMNMTETASAVGFDDSNYFSRAFKKCVGMSPSEFRKQILA
jgi:AraC-like DNA-binding protein